MPITITPTEWGQVREDVGYIRAKIEEWSDVPARVDALEANVIEERGRVKQQELSWRKRDKIYIRLFATIGALGAIVSMATVIISSLNPGG